MRNRLFGLAAILALATGCTPARVVGNAAIDLGQVTLGAVDMLI